MLARIAIMPTPQASLFAGVNSLHGSSPNPHTNVDGLAYHVRLLPSKRCLHLISASKDESVFVNGALSFMIPTAHWRSEGAGRASRPRRHLDRGGKEGKRHFYLT